MDIMPCTYLETNMQQMAKVAKVEIQKLRIPTSVINFVLLSNQTVIMHCSFQPVCMSAKETIKTVTLG